MLPERDIQTVQAWIDGKNDAVETGVRARLDEIYRRPVAFHRGWDLWSLYWRDSSETYHLYFEFNAYSDVGDLLAEIDRDPTAIFWG